MPSRCTATCERFGERERERKINERDSKDDGIAMKDDGVTMRAWKSHSKRAATATATSSPPQYNHGSTIAERTVDRMVVQDSDDGYASRMQCLDERTDLRG